MEKSGEELGRELRWIEMFPPAAAVGHRNFGGRRGSWIFRWILWRRSIAG